MTISAHNQFMLRAIELARNTSIVTKAGGPFGCVIVKNNEIVGEGANSVLADGDSTSHAEMNAIRSACKKLGTHDLAGCVVYSTGEPCPMCYGACCWARVDAIHYATTIQDATAFGNFDDDIFFEDIKLPSKDRNLAGKELLRDEMLKVWSEFKNMHEKLHY
ncbi:MAG: nucleoside deaminase [Phycisphaerae bacterium]|nr:nucleoside deaminase [Phycisphaerae bacterium]MBT6282521.1 nucleoside deaminase [Phycisphaerae bacterium]